MPAPDFALLLAAAGEAGEVAMGYWKQAPKVWDKGAEGPVTEADIAVNTALEARLRSARPDYGWLSEESPDDGSWRRAGRAFVVDPIDGTRAFIAGQTGFSHALAVVEDGRPVAAVVHLPAMGRTYAAAAGGQASLNGAPIHASAPPRDDRVLASAAAFAPEHWPGGVPPFRRTQRPSLAWRLCLVAEGAFAALVTLRDTWLWDMAAGALIAERAGARVTDRNGTALAMTETRLPGLLVAPPALHADLATRRRDAAVA